MTPDAAPRIGPYSVILDIAKAMVAGDSLEDTLHAIVENIGRAMFAETATLGSYYPERDEYVCEASWRDGGLTRQEAANIGRVYRISKHPAIRRAIDSRQPVACQIDDPRLVENDRQNLADWGLKTTLDGRLVYGSSVIGLLGVAESRFVRRFTPSELALFSQLCDLAAIGIHSARQARQLDEARSRLVANERSPEADVAGPATAG